MGTFETEKQYPYAQDAFFAASRGHMACPVNEKISLFGGECTAALVGSTYPTRKHQRVKLIIRLDHPKWGAFGHVSPESFKWNGWADARRIFQDTISEALRLSECGDNFLRFVGAQSGFHKWKPERSDIIERYNLPIVTALQTEQYAQDRANGW